MAACASGGQKEHAPVLAGVVKAACEFAVEVGSELHTGDEFERSHRSEYRIAWQTKWWLIKPTAGTASTLSPAFRREYLRNCISSAVHGGVRAPQRVAW